jgi:hypothetical protein
MVANKSGTDFSLSHLQLQQDCNNQSTYDSLLKTLHPTNPQTTKPTAFKTP